MNAEKSVDVTISIVHWNTPELLKTCLKSILETTKNVSYEIFVADSNSSDRASFEKIRDSYANDVRLSFFIHDENIAGLAQNPLFARARGKYFAYVCPDAQALPGCLDALVAFLDSNQEAGAVTPVLLNPDHSIQMYYCRMLTPKLHFFSTFIGQNIDKHVFGGRYNRYYRYADLDVTKMSEVEQPSLPFLLLRPEAVSGEPIIDPQLPTYFADVDICKRIYNHCYKIYLVPEAQVIHKKSASLNQSASAWARRAYYRGLVVYIKKYYPLLVPFVIVYYFINRLAQRCAALLFGKPITL